MTITVLGAGAWGTALAKILQENGNAVTLWDKNAATLDEIQRGRNERYLPGVALPTDWKTQADFKKAIGGAEGVVLAVPSQAFREVSEKTGKVIREFLSASPRALNLRPAIR